MSAMIGKCKHGIVVAATVSEFMPSWFNDDQIETIEKTRDEYPTVSRCADCKTGAERGDK